MLRTYEEKGKVEIGKSGPGEKKLNSVVDEFDLNNAGSITWSG